MNISGISLHEFTRITSTVSVQKYGGNIIVSQDGHDTGTRKPRCTARLAARDSHGAGARVCWSGRHGPWACWHAYRDVLAAVFYANPEAVIRTGIGGGTLYRGRDGFLAAYPATAGVNIGSQVQPAYMPDLCECASTQTPDVPQRGPDYSAAHYAARRAESNALIEQQNAQDMAEYASTAPTSDAMLAYKKIEDEFAGTWANSLHP